jgi:hypothetical protein
VGHEVIANLIAAKFAATRIARDGFQGAWNYVISPNR